jgi:hypothetical protein
MDRISVDRMEDTLAFLKVVRWEAGSKAASSFPIRPCFAVTVNKSQGRS